MKTQIRWTNRRIIQEIIVPLFVEFICLFLHTFWGSMGYNEPRNVMNLNGTHLPYDYQVNYFTSALVPALQVGFAVWIFVVMWWKVCVAHFNPAVTMVLLVSGDFVALMVIPFIIAQCLGSMLGAIVAQSLRNGDNIGVFLISDEADIFSILITEMIITGFLCFMIVVQVGNKDYDQQTGPLAIGMVSFQGVLAGRWVGAGLMNPARAFGPAVVVGGAAWNYHWVWWVGDLTGAALFGLLFRCFFAPGDKAWIMKLAKNVKPKENHEDQNSEKL